MMLYILLALTALLISAALAWPVVREPELPEARRKPMVAIMLLAMAGGSAGLYYALGAPGWIEPINEQRAHHAHIRERIFTLTTQAEAEPQDAHILFALGETWLQAGEAERAIDPLRKAVLISGGQPDVIATYAAALVMENDGIVNEQAADSIAMALTLNPAQPLARSLESLYHRQQSAHNVPE